MANEKDYAEMIQQAELAVTPVKDPELKKIAFEKILDALLARNEGRAPTSKTKSEPKRRGKAAHSGAASQKRHSKGRGPQGYINELIDEGFFNKPKTIAEVKVELGNRGHHIPLTHLSNPLQRLCRGKRLRRQKTDTDDRKGIFAYSNW